MNSPLTLGEKGGNSEKFGESRGISDHIGRLHLIFPLFSSSVKDGRMCLRIYEGFPPGPFGPRIWTRL
jgi:hypothetical protein